MSVKLNTPLINKILTLDEVILPDLPDVTTKIFAQHAPKAGKEACKLKSSITVLKGIQQELLDAPENIRKAERSEKIHKILCITLLAVAVSLLATALILGFLVNPICFSIVIGTAIAFIAANVLNPDNDYPNNIPPTIAELQKEDEEAQLTLNIHLHRLLTVQEQKSRIEEGIKRELKSIDLSDPQADMVRVNDLRAALARLEQVNAFFELLK